MCLKLHLYKRDLDRRIATAVLITGKGEAMKKKIMHRTLDTIFGNYTLCGLGPEKEWDGTWFMSSKITCKTCLRIEKSRKKKRAG